MRLVEFVGPPCAGKTTVARALLRSTHRRSGSGGAPIHWRDARLLVRRPRFAAAPTLLRMLPAPLGAAPIVTDLLLGAPRESEVVGAATGLAQAWGPMFERALRGRTDDDGLLGMLARRWAIEALLTRAMLERTRGTGDPSDVAILDEGVTHPYKVAALADADDVAGLLDVLPMPDALVRFHVADDVLTRRLTARRAARPDGPRERSWSTPERLEQEVVRVQRLVGAVAEAARGRGVPVIDVDGAADPLDVVASLAASLADLGSGPAMDRDR